MVGAAAQRLSIEEAMGSPDLAARTAMTRMREERGWNYSDLARAVNTTPTQIRKLENGDINISLSWMERLARAFGVKMSAFLQANEIDANLDAPTQAIFDLIADIPPSERLALLQAAMQMLTLARRLGNTAGTPLVGNSELAEQVADRWNRWNEPQRRQAVDLLKMAESLGAR